MDIENKFLVLIFLENARELRVIVLIDGKNGLIIADFMACVSFLGRKRVISDAN